MAGKSMICGSHDIFVCNTISMSAFCTCDFFSGLIFWGLQELYNYCCNRRSM